MQYSYFPVRGVELAARVKFTELGEETFNIGDLEVSTKSMNHPIRVLAFKFKHKGKSSSTPGTMSLTMMSWRSGPGPWTRGSPALGVHQGVQSAGGGLLPRLGHADRGLPVHRPGIRVQAGLGPQLHLHVLNLSQESSVKKLILFHHEPTHDDKELEKIERQARARGRKMKGKFKVISAREGMVLDV